MQHRGVSVTSNRACGDRRLGKIGPVLFVGLALLLLWRITLGMDLTDEAYYAIFIDDWLKGSIRSSSFLSLHQTAALIVYPATKLYQSVAGTSDGLFLFLRGLFLSGAVVSAGAWFVFMLRLGSRLLAWTACIAVLAFVPFGLPAPSYNTLGQQALTVALAAFGCAAFADGGNRTQLGWLALSGVAWAVAVVAYPSMIVPCALLCLAGILDRSDFFPRPIMYLLLTGVAVVVGGILAVWFLSWGRLYEGLVYQSAITDIGGWSRKLNFVVEKFSTNFVFFALLVVATIAGLIRGHYPRFTACISTGVLACLFILPPTLFVRSHDAVTLGALTGLGLLFGLREGVSRTERVIGYIYGASLAAALTTYGTAYNSIFNFAVGAVPAAALAVTIQPTRKSLGPIFIMPASALILAVLSTSLFFFYGESPSDAPRERIDRGVFAGLSVSPVDAGLVHMMQERVDPLLPSGQSIVLISRLPGLILATRARLAMPTTFPLLPSVSKRGLEMTGEFYARYQPDIVLIYRDPFFTIVNPIADFDQRYVRVSEFEAKLGSLTVFRRRQ